MRRCANRWVTCGIAGVAALLISGARARGAEDFPSNAPMAELVGWAQVYGSTPLKKANRELARAELSARGGESLAYLLAHVHMTNETLRMLIDDLVREKLSADVSAPVLADALASTQGAARKVAAYYLGLTDATNFAARLLPLLNDDVAKGAAARTLGKWHCREAVPGILPLLEDPKEPRRVVAVNALRDIGDPAALPALIGALGDESFTVRKAAARALGTFGRRGETALLAALPTLAGSARREAVRALGAMASRRAERPLRRLRAETADDPGLRDDIDSALLAIQANRK